MYPNFSPFQYPPPPQKKTSESQKFSGGIEMVHWTLMACWYFQLFLAKIFNEINNTFSLENYFTC